MSFLQRIFGRAPAAPLPPMEDTVLGRLTWDADSEGWTGTIPYGHGTARLHIGAGSSQQYPSELILRLLREPYEKFPQLVENALVFLPENMDLRAWKADASRFTVEGLESYDHYLADEAYTVTFTHGKDEAIWKVHFKNLQPTGCGVDG